ncbi:hypothetical protein B0H11DRAFT_1152805 [Mycena galericulata]|nr:hypothetical protein B0H11DRAFT_1152805 [Mycena galericulata]
MESSKHSISMPYPVYASDLPKYSAESKSTLGDPSKIVDNQRDIARTPSPTQSEFDFLNNVKKEKSTKQKIQYYGIIAVLLIVTILISVFHSKIITALQPATNWLADHKIGPLIPIALLIILSFPPLFGHEIVGMLVGVTWGLPEAFLIVAIGTLLGEIANFFTFKYACTARGEKMEAKDLSYGILAHVVRNGGFIVVLVVRYSAIPAHFATAVFSTVGVSFGIFIAAAILSLPKPLVSVYVGYALKPSNDSTMSERIEKIVLVVSVLITIAALNWMKRKMNAAKEEFVYSRRKARQANGAASNGGLHFISAPDVV